MDAQPPRGTHAEPAARLDSGDGDDGRAAPWLIDVLLGTAIALAIALIIATEQGGQRPPDVLAYLFAAGFGALMLLRRAFPRTTLVVTVIGLFGYYTMDYPPIGVAIPVVAALYSAAEAGLMAWCVGAGCVVFGVSTFFRMREGEPLAYLLGYELVSNVALMAAAVALGDGVRNRRARRAEQEEIDRLTAEHLTREADRRIQGERENIARDLHDLVGHQMSVISLQSNVAAEAIGRDPGAASDAVDRIRAASGQTIQDLRATVRVLRSPPQQDAGRGVVSLADVETVFRSARAAGVRVTSEIEVAPSELSAAIDAAAYRIVQESLTNVIRHAGASHARVQAVLREGTLRVSVTDDGRGRTTTEDRSGHGLAGMTERVRLLGGTLATRSEYGKGFAIEAELPARLVS